MNLGKSLYRNTTDNDCSYYVDLFEKEEQIIVVTLLKNKNFKCDQQKCKSLNHVESRLGALKVPYIAILRGQLWRCNID